MKDWEDLTADEAVLFASMAIHYNYPTMFPNMHKLVEEMIANEQPPLKCPNCDDIGYYWIGGGSEPTPEQCEFCYTEPNSIFNRNQNMKSFKQFITEEPKGTYAAVRPHSHDGALLHQWMIDNDVKNQEPINKLHCTLLYSRKPLPKYKPDTNLLHESTIDGLDVWHTKSGKNCLVLKLTSNSLVKRHEQLMTQHEATYDWPEYKTHISLSYDIGDAPLSSFNASTLPKHLLLTDEYQEELDTGGK
jgi:hypothetical protein